MNLTSYYPTKSTLTEADKKFIDQYIAPFAKTSYALVVNPISGWETNTNPLIATLVYFTQALAYSDFSHQRKVEWGIASLSNAKIIQLYDRARMIILKLDREIYSNIID